MCKTQMNPKTIKKNAYESTSPASIYSSSERNTDAFEESKMNPLPCLGQIMKST